VGFFKAWGEFMMVATRAHAAWELETSNRIVNDPKRLLVLVLLVVPIFVFGPVVAAQMIDQAAAAGDLLPDILGGKKAYSPAFYSPTSSAARRPIALPSTRPESSSPRSSSGSAPASSPAASAPGAALSSLPP